MQNLIALVLLMSLILTSGANAASYLLTDGEVIDPIQNRYGGDLAYTGPDLEGDAHLAGVNLSDAYLDSAYLQHADLRGADLTGAELSDGDLSFADLTDANLRAARLDAVDLTGATLSYADLRHATLFDASVPLATLSYANLSYVDLSYVDGLSSASGIAYYNAETDFSHTGFDPVAAGWIFVPEPSGMLLGLAALSCVGLLARRRAH